jgi:maleylacetoacetate isomerase
MKLYTYYRSSSSYRVRIALHYKELNFEQVPVHLLNDGGEQYHKDYLKLNPRAEVPYLVDHGIGLSQSVSIFFYLDRAHMEKPLFPKSFPEFEKCLELVEIINSGIQPLQNLSVLQKLQKDFKISDDEKEAWCRHFIEKGLKAFDQKASSDGPFSMGDEITAADMFLIPQLYSARRFNLDLGTYKNLLRIDEACQAIKAFNLAHPENQKDHP